MIIKEKNRKEFPGDMVDKHKYGPDTLEFIMGLFPQDPGEALAKNLKRFTRKMSIPINQIEDMRSWIFAYAFDIGLSLSKLSGPEIQMVIENKYKIICRVRMSRYGFHFGMSNYYYLEGIGWEHTGE